MESVPKMFAVGFLSLVSAAAIYVAFGAYTEGLQLSETMESTTDLVMNDDVEKVNTAFSKAGYSSLFALTTGVVALYTALTRR